VPNGVSHLLYSRLGQLAISQRRLLGRESGLDLTNPRSLLLRRPIHSNFLVAAVITYAAEGDDPATAPLRHVVGVNTETCVLPSAICAERTALVQLRLRHPPVQPGGVRGVYITTTETGSGALITPGLLCREMLQVRGWEPPSCGDVHAAGAARGPHCRAGTGADVVRQGSEV
jgi:hypothetical protein